MGEVFVLTHPNTCRVCGVYLVEGENFSNSANEKKDRICRPCNAKKMQQWRYNNPDRYEAIKKKEREKYQEEKDERLAWQRQYKEKEPLRYYFNKIKNQATSRGYEFNLSREEFAEYWQKPCSYCGDSVKTIGLDRVDNSKGYESGNVVSCCIVCNKMKSNYTKEFFFNHCKKIMSRV